MDWSYASLSTVNNILSVVGDGNSAVSGGYQVLGKGLTNDVFYFYTRERVTDGVATTVFLLIRDGIAGNIIANILATNFNINEWNEISFKATLTFDTVSGV